jgi:hypothetical protein
MKRFILLVGCALAVAGCQTQRPLYYWGNYEAIGYLGYSKPGKVPLEMQREKHEEDIEKAKGHNLAANPGLHAQLGYVYYQLNRPDDAIREFTAEKLLFPESAVFMDRMIEKTKGGPSK